MTEQVSFLGHVIISERLRLSREVSGNTKFSLTEESTGVARCFRTTVLIGGPF